MPQRPCDPPGRMFGIPPSRTYGGLAWRTGDQRPQDNEKAEANNKLLIAPELKGKSSKENPDEVGSNEW